jgi:hypothetical protein
MPNETPAPLSIDEAAALLNTPEEAPIEQQLPTDALPISEEPTVPAMAKTRPPNPKRSSRREAIFGAMNYKTNCGESLIESLRNIFDVIENPPSTETSRKGIARRLKAPVGTQPDRARR